MANLQNRSTVLINLSIVTFLLLLCQNVVMVRPEDSFKVALFDNLHFGENVLTDGGPEQDLNSFNVMSTVQDNETPEEDRKSYRTAGDSGTGMGISQEVKNKIQGIQKIMSIPTPKRPRFLCLHGHGSNAAQFENYFDVWPKFVTDKMDLVFINGPIPIYDNEHFVWFTFDKVNMEYINFEEGTIGYIEDRMIELGPFDGVLGFSEGAFLTGALPGMQEQGACLKKVKKIKHVVIISGAKFGGKSLPYVPKLAENAYSSPINIPSLHIFGKNDTEWPNSPELVEAYVDPLVINHSGGHEVPKLDEEGLEIMAEFLKKINAIA